MMASGKDAQATNRSFSRIASAGRQFSLQTVGNLVFLAGANLQRPRRWYSDSGARPHRRRGLRSRPSLCSHAIGGYQRHLRSLDEIKETVSVNGYVNAIAGFPDTPKVINGASDLFIELLGESARHVRAAIGVSSLPRNALVESE